MGQDIIFYDTFLHKHTPTKVITHLLKHQGSTSQHLNLRSKFIRGTERHCATIEGSLTTGTHGAAHGAGKAFYILSMHLNSHSYSLLTSFLSVMVVTSAGTLSERAQGGVVQNKKGLKQWILAVHKAKRGNMHKEYEQINWF